MTKFKTKFKTKTNTNPVMSLSKL